MESYRQNCVMFDIFAITAFHSFLCLCFKIQGMENFTLLYFSTPNVVSSEPSAQNPERNSILLVLGNTPLSLR